MVCPCGKRLQAAGAVPGRVGRCPACGARFQVPGETASSRRRSRQGNPRRSCPRARRWGRRPSSRPPEGPTAPPGRRRFRQREGLIRPPHQLETRLRDSLLYPLWGATGLSLLVVMPPFFWLTSLPIISVVAVLLAEGLSASTRFGVDVPGRHRAVLCPGAELHAPVPGPGARLERPGRGPPSALAELGPGRDVPGALPLVLGHRGRGRHRGHPCGGLLDLVWRPRPARHRGPRGSARAGGGLRPDGAAGDASCTTILWGPTRSP